jgi:hypothetical protein
LSNKQSAVLHNAPLLPQCRQHRQRMPMIPAKTALTVPTVQTVLTAVERFSSDELILIVRVPARPSRAKVISIPNIRARRSAEAYRRRADDAPTVGADLDGAPAFIGEIEMDLAGMLGEADMNRPLGAIKLGVRLE